MNTNELYTNRIKRAFDEVDPKWKGLISAIELNSLTLVSLVHGYVNATTETLRTSFVVAATYGYYALPIQTVISFALGPLAYLLWCVPMVKSFFGRWTAIFGIIASIIGHIETAFNVSQPPISSACASS